MKKITYIFFFLLGLFTLLSQTILLREFIYFFRGNELSVAFFYFSWFFWIAAGAFVLRSSRRVHEFIDRNFDLFTILYPLLLLLQILLIRYSRTLAGYEPYEVIPPHAAAFSALLSNLPLSLFTGTLFTSGSARFSRFAGRAVSAGFIVESVGSFAGGAAATYLIYSALQPIDAVYIASAFFVAFPLLSAFSNAGLEGLRRSRFIILIISAVLLAALVAGFLTGGFARLKDFTARARFSGSVPGASLIKEIDTAYQSVSIGKLRDQHFVLLNGTVSLSFPLVEERRVTTGILFGQTEGIGDVLLIGEGALQVADAVLEYPVRAVTLLIQDSKLLEAIRENMPEKELSFLSDNRLRVICGDPRLEIRKLAEEQHEFDLVLVLTGDPETILSNRYFTTEFFSETARIMKVGGIFAHRISSAENFAGTEIRRFGQSLFATLSGVFADVAITSGDKSIFLAARKQGILSLDFEHLRKNLKSYFPGRAPPFQIETIRPAILPERLKFVKELYSGSELNGADLINSDNMPVTLFFSLLAGLKQSDSPLVSLLHNLRRHGFFFTLVFTAIFLILALHKRVVRPSSGGSSFVESYAILATGAAAITIQIILMIGFQARYGFLYREIGIVNALFMAGLALGGFSFRKFSAPCRGASAVFIPMLSYAVFIVALIFLPVLPQQGTAILFYALFPINGFIAGSIWPLVEKGSSGSALETASRLEMNDHIGAAAGALACGFLMTPLFGTRGTLLILLPFFACGIALASYEMVARKKARAFLDSLQKREAPSFENLRLSYFVFGGIIFFIVSGIALKSRETATAELGAGEIKEVSLSEKKPFTRKDRPFLHYSIDDEKSGKILEVALSSLSVAPDVKGFAGAINLLMKIDGDGIIKRVKLLSSKETPVYIKGIGKWLKSFEGKSVAEDFRFEEGGEIDAMTGATITSEAALKIINRTKNAVAGEILKIPFKESPEKSLLETIMDIRTIYVILALAGSIAIYYLAGNLVRLLWLLMNLILGGAVFNIQFSITHLYNLLSLEFPSPEGGYIFFLLIGIILLLPLFGPIYCGQMCPFGALQEVISRTAGLRGMKPSRKFENAVRGIKYLLLLFFTAVFLDDEPHRFFSYDPLANFFNFKYSGMMIPVIALVLALNLIYSRFYCRYFCPVGAFFNLFNMIALKLPWRRRHRYPACHYGVKNGSDVECIQCNRCLGGMK